MTLKVKSYKKQIADAVFQLLNDIETYSQKGSVDIRNSTFYSVESIISAHVSTFETINNTFNRSDFNVNSLHTIVNAIEEHYEGSYC